MLTFLFLLFIGFCLTVGICVRIYMKAYNKDPAKAKSNLHTILYGFNTGNTTYLAEKAKQEAKERAEFEEWKRANKK